MRAGLVAFRDWRRSGKNVGQIGLRGYCYDALIFAFRVPIGSLKKNATAHLLLCHPVIFLFSVLFL